MERKKAYFDNLLTGRYQVADSEKALRGARRIVQTIFTKKKKKKKKKRNRLAAADPHN